MKKITLIQAEEAWEANSELIGEDIDSLSEVAGTIHMRKSDFLNALSELNKGKY